MFKGNKLMTCTQRLFFLHKYMQCPSSLAVSQRAFSTGHELTHEEHGHEQHVEKADPNHKFLQIFDKKYIALNGLPPTAPATLEFCNPFRHHNNLPLWEYLILF